MTARTFDALRAGTAETDWLASRLRDAPWLAAPARGDVLVVVAAHPDDETLGAGGLIATAAARGATVRVVVATDGEASHPYSPTHDRVRLATIRRHEVRTAVARLAGVEPVLLGLPDGALREHRDALTHLLEPHLQDATHVVATWPGDGHPDHEACGAAAAAAAARKAVPCWQYPIWAWHWADPAQDELPWPRLARLRLDDAAQQAKRVALDGYVSQHSALSPAVGDEAILTGQMRAHFAREFETFAVATPTADPAYFDALYDESEDPWGLADRFYEQRKREVLLASLPRRSFARAFEPGCATGELTIRLAERCGEVVAWDAASAAVHRVRRRAPRNVVVEQGQIPQQWPAGSFDLVVLSEVGYYSAHLDALVRRLCDALAEDGLVVACHWRHPAPHHAVSGDAVHDALAAGLRERAHHTVHHEERDFLLDVWSVDARSVAERDGLAP